MKVSSRDSELLSTIEASWTEGSERSGAWLVCRQGCSDCCVGPFAITALDAWRLKEGMAVLRQKDPRRWTRVLESANRSVRSFAQEFPGDIVTGILSGEEQKEAVFFEKFSDVPCPALDPQSLLCDLYTSRPISCRTFGLPVKMGGLDLEPCSLCFQGASESEVERCRVTVSGERLEETLVQVVEEAEGRSGETLVAFAVLEVVEKAGPGTQQVSD